MIRPVSNPNLRRAAFGPALRDPPAFDVASEATSQRSRRFGTPLLGIGMALLLSGCASASPREERSPGAAPPAPRIRVETADQLPRHAYRIDTTASALLLDDTRFEALAEQVEADINSDLGTYDIRDRATLKGYYGTLAALALHRRDYDVAVAYEDSVCALEDKPALRLVAGIPDRALAEASRAPEDRFQEVFRESFRRQIAALPYEQVQAELVSRRGTLNILSPNVLVGSIKSQVDPAAQSGEISMGLAQQVVGNRAAVDWIMPVRVSMSEVLDEIIAAHTVERPGIWADRDVSLEGRDDLTPVTVAIWDTGLDTDLFPGRLFTNPAETPGNGKDDDGNGFVDDVHGIAHDLHGERVSDVLMPLTLTPAEVREYLSYGKGFSDLQAGIDSPEARSLKQHVAGLTPDGVGSFVEDLKQVSNYVHGTHVAGIAARGNPAIRLLIGRLTPDWRTIPEVPTLELVRVSAQEFRETVEYFERYGVRVVNMSWGTFPAEFESALEKNNAGGSADQRRELAHRMFAIVSDALREAIKSAPDILFVAAAGNENYDNRFNEWVPAALDLPNLITAGAVDQAGDEAAFTSYGKVDVYANGYEVSSTVPGGDTIPMSGTSMASPQVVNLAAKLLALRPDLPVAELRAAIVDAAEEKTIGEDRTIRLLDPKASVERVLASRQVEVNPRVLVGDWDAWQGAERQVKILIHVPADSVGATARFRVGGNALPTIVSVRLSGDSAFFIWGPTVEVVGELRGDTVVGHLMLPGQILADSRVRMVRRAVPTPVVQPYRLWPGPVSDSAYQVAVDTAVPMRARDGTTMMNLVVRPLGEGPFPVVLERTPYGRMGTEPSFQAIGRSFAQRGYIYVAQDTRGRYGSGGTFRSLAGQDTDGYDAVEWAAALPGSSGKVGMRGNSFDGWTQWYAAVMHPPHLAAIVPTVAPPDPWLNVPYWNMTFPVSFAAWACLVSGKVNQPVRDLDWERGLHILPVSAIPDSLGCKETAFWDDWMEHETLDAFWLERSYQARLSDVQVPVLAISGWYDDDGIGTTTNFVGLGQVSGHPFQRMVIGPWSHYGTPDLLYGDFGSLAWVDHQMLELRWFDHYLKDIDNGVDREAPVTVFVMGDNVWRSEREWPLARTRWTRFYLHSGGRANGSGGDGTLDSLPPGPEPADTFSYDPGDPTPYLVDPRDFNLNLNEDYRELHAARRDVLVYTTEPLQRDVEVTGPLSVTLWAVTDARDTDWHAMLLDVFPDGRAYRVQDGIVRARFREGFYREVFSVPGEPTRYTIDLWHTSLVFKAGHRIRIAIASAAFPKYGRNLNTGGDNNADTVYVTAHQRVLHDGTHASFVTLPVIPR